MKDLTSFEDCGLQEIQFINFGKDLLVTFHSSYNGDDIGSLICRDLILFKYSDFYREHINHNAAEIDKGFYASYIACIKIEKISDYYKIEFEPMEESITIHCLSYEII